MKGAILRFSITVLLLIPVSSFSAERMRIAIVDFTSKQGVSAAIANTISELIRTEMINTGKYVVIERAQMGEILKEQGLQQTGCTDVSCAVEVGKILSAKKILLGNILKLGKMIIINGRIVDVEKGVAEFGQKQNAKNEDDLYRAVSAFTANLTRRILGSASAEPKKEVVKKEEEPEEEEEQLPPIEIPNTRVTVNGSYILPQGGFSDIADPGIGAGVNLVLNNMFFQNSSFMLNAAYYGLKSAQDDVDKLDVIQFSANIGFPMRLSRRITVVPFVGGGYLMHSVTSDSEGAKKYFDPMAVARLELGIAFSSSMQLVLMPGYVYFFEKSGSGQMILGEAGFRFSF